MLALAIWDEENGSLLLAMDRFGMKPLYLVTAPWGIAFASELKALHAMALTGGELDWNALDVFFQLGYMPTPATPLKGVRKLEPGHLLTWRDTGRITSRQCWDIRRRSHGQRSPCGRLSQRRDGLFGRHFEHGACR